MAASSVSRVCMASVSLCNPVWLVYQHHKFNKQIPCYRGVHTIFIKLGRYLDLTWSANSKPANSLTIVQNKLRHGILGPLLRKTRWIFVHQMICMGILSKLKDKLTTQTKFTCLKWATETIERCKIRSKLTIKTPERRQWRPSCVFIVNLKHISHLFQFFF